MSFESSNGFHLFIWASATLQMTPNGRLSSTNFLNQFRLIEVGLIMRALTNPEL